MNGGLESGNILLEQNVSRIDKSHLRNDENDL